MARIESATSIETNLMSNRKVIELLLQLKSARAHGKNYIKVKPHVVYHLLGNHLLLCLCKRLNDYQVIFVTKTKQNNSQSDLTSMQVLPGRLSFVYIILI